MKLKNPILLIQNDSQKRVLLFLSVLLFGLMLIIILSGPSLVPGIAPYGVVSLELAGSVDRTETILRSWGLDGLVRASFSLGLDFLFIPVYTVTIGSWIAIAHSAMEKRKLRYGSIGSLIAWGIFAAGIFDMIENIALLIILFDEVNAPWPQIAAWFSGMKFVLIILGILYLILGAMVSVSTRLSEEQR